MDPAMLKGMSQCPFLLTSMLALVLLQVKLHTDPTTRLNAGMAVDVNYYLILGYATQKIKLYFINVRHKGNSE